MINVQLTFDEKLLIEVDKIRKPLGLDLTEIISEALIAWLKKRQSLYFEQAWVAALKNNPDTESRAEEWLKVQDWTTS